MRNDPDLWLRDFPRPANDCHKYDRGHAFVLASDHLTGATRLAAEACARIGAGLVSVGSESKGDLFRTALPPDIMVIDALEALPRGLACALAGPGGFSNWHAQRFATLPQALPLVLDAEAIIWWTRQPGMSRDVVLTPHEGEFARAFPELSGERETRAGTAASQTRTTIVLKGPETVIACADGRLVLNDHASPYLAKAGTGDVLAGLIAGLVAQGMAAFEAACAAVWIHGEASRRIGPGLVAGDLSAQVPAILMDLL